MMRAMRVGHALGWPAALASCLLACGTGTEGAAQSARLVLLEQEVRKLAESVAAQQPPPPAQPELPVARELAFKLDCPQPWLVNPPLGAALWTCQAPEPTPQGMYPQCSVTVQPHAAIETKSYFEYAMNASPQLLMVKNLTDKRVAINGADAFEASFEADPKPIPLKMIGALLPREQLAYTVTCFAPSAEFAGHAKAFRRIIDSFAFK